MTLAEHLAYLEAAFGEARAAPLSAKKAMLVALLLDAQVDRLFRAQSEFDDLLAFRDALAEKSPALSLVLQLAAGEVRLVTEAVEVPLAEYHTLGVEDFMVSLYNRHTVMRVRVPMADGSRLFAHDILSEAISAIGRHLPNGR